MSALSGDIIVSPVPGGYLVGRLRARTPPDEGLAWEYIRTEPDLQAAIRFARQVAERANVGAWACEGEIAFLKISLGPPLGR